MSRNDVILGIAAAVLVGFSLVVSIVVPRRNPDFPGRQLRFFTLVVVLLVLGMLTAVEVLGESHHFNAAEGGSSTAAPATTPTTGSTSTLSTSTGGGGGGAQGNAAAGKQIFTATAQPPCATCHTLQEAGATGMVGPNLDDALKGKDAAFIHESIVDPNAQIASGFQAGIMPQNYGQQLNDQQLADVVAFLVQSTS
ncbi:MAG TPA: cytochrome c [Gaiellaceae bacterium]